MMFLVERWLERGLRLLAYAGGLVLFGLMLLVIYEINMRYFYGRPFRGGYELTELAMSLIVAFGLPYTAYKGGHVSMDLFSRWLDAPWMRWLTVTVHLFGAIVLAVVSWRAFVYAGVGMQYGDMTNMMRVPKYPFQFAVATSLALFALVLLLHAVRSLNGHEPARKEA